jgi:hypothetical protein
LLKGASQACLCVARKQAFSSVAERCLAKGSSIRFIFNQKSAISNQKSAISYSGFWLLK